MGQRVHWKRERGFSITFVLKRDFERTVVQELLVLGEGSDERVTVGEINVAVSFRSSVVVWQTHSLDLEPERERRRERMQFEVEHAQVRQLATLRSLKKARIFSSSASKLMLLR